MERPNESAPVMLTATLTDGPGVISQEYESPQDTTLMLSRTFDAPGTVYTVSLNAKVLAFWHSGIFFFPTTFFFFQNNHFAGNEAKLWWEVICASPVVAADWTLTYDPDIVLGEYFTVTLEIGPSKPLPTR